MNRIEKKNIDFFNKYFPTYNKVDKSKLQITTEGIYSVSGVAAASFISKIIFKIFKTNKIIITDATANNGSDSIMFAILFSKVNSIELEDTNFKVLKNNLYQYKLKNVSPYKGNSLEIISKLKQDVIFIDAPWKKKHKGYEILQIYLYKNTKENSEKIEISEIFNMFKKNCKVMIFKVPLYYDFGYFFTHSKTKKFTVVPFHNEKNKVVFHYIICFTKQH